MILINCEIELTLTWCKNCVVLSNSRRDAIAATELSSTIVSNVKPAVNASATNATFKITDRKLYVPVVTLSNKSNKKLLEPLRTGFKRTIKWNNYRSVMTNQTQNNYLNYLIDLTFTKGNRLFVFSFENENDRTSFSKYYVPNEMSKQNTYRMC